MKACRSFLVFCRFPLSSAARRTTLILLTPLKRSWFRPPSPHRRVARAVSPVAYGHGLPTIGRRRASPVMVWIRFLQAAARVTRRGPHPAFRVAGCGGGRFGPSVGTSSRGGEWRTRPADSAVSQSRLAWPLRHAAFSGPPGGDTLAAYLRLTATEFEQGVLHKCGLAQVGFGVRFVLLSRLTVSSQVY